MDRDTFSWQAARTDFVKNMPIVNLQESPCVRQIILDNADIPRTYPECKHYHLSRYTRSLLFHIPRPTCIIPQHCIEEVTRQSRAKLAHYNETMRTGKHTGKTGSGKLITSSTPGAAALNSIAYNILH